MVQKSKGLFLLIVTTTDVCLFVCLLSRRLFRRIYKKPQMRKEKLFHMQITGLYLTNEENYYGVRRKYSIILYSLQNLLITKSVIYYSEKQITSHQFIDSFTVTCQSNSYVQEQALHTMTGSLLILQLNRVHNI